MDGGDVVVARVCAGSVHVTTTRAGDAAAATTLVLTPPPTTTPPTQLLAATVVPPYVLAVDDAATVHCWSLAPAASVYSSTALHRGGGGSLAAAHFPPTPTAAAAAPLFCVLQPAATTAIPLVAAIHLPHTAGRLRVSLCPLVEPPPPPPSAAAAPSSLSPVRVPKLPAAATATAAGEVTPPESFAHPVAREPQCGGILGWVMGMVLGAPGTPSRAADFARSRRRRHHTQQHEGDSDLEANDTAIEAVVAAPAAVDSLPSPPPTGNPTAAPPTAAAAVVVSPVVAVAVESLPEAASADALVGVLHRSGALHLWAVTAIEDDGGDDDDDGAGLAVSPWLATTVSDLLPVHHDAAVYAGTLALQAAASDAATVSLVLCVDSRPPQHAPHDGGNNASPSPLPTAAVAALHLPTRRVRGVVDLVLPPAIAGMVVASAAGGAPCITPQWCAYAPFLAGAALTHDGASLLAAWHGTAPHHHHPARCPCGPPLLVVHKLLNAPAVAAGTCGTAVGALAGSAGTWQCVTPQPRVMAGAAALAALGGVSVPAARDAALAVLLPAVVPDAYALALSVEDAAWRGAVPPALCAADALVTLVARLHEVAEAPDRPAPLRVEPSRRMPHAHPGWKRARSNMVPLFGATTAATTMPAAAATAAAAAPTVGDEVSGAAPLITTLEGAVGEHFLAQHVRALWRARVPRRALLQVAAAGVGDGGVAVSDGEPSEGATVAALRTCVQHVATAHLAAWQARVAEADRSQAAVYAATLHAFVVAWRGMYVRLAAALAPGDLHGARLVVAPAAHTSSLVVMTGGDGGGATWLWQPAATGAEPAAVSGGGRRSRVAPPPRGDAPPVEDGLCFAPLCRPAVAFLRDLDAMGHAATGKPRGRPLFGSGKPPYSAVTHAALEAALPPAAAPTVATPADALATLVAAAAILASLLPPSVSFRAATLADATATAAGAAALRNRVAACFADVVEALGSGSLTEGATDTMFPPSDAATPPPPPPPPAAASPMGFIAALELHWEALLLAAVPAGGAALPAAATPPPLAELARESATWPAEPLAAATDAALRTGWAHRLGSWLVQGGDAALLHASAVSAASSTTHLPDAAPLAAVLGPAVPAAVFAALRLAAAAARSLQADDVNVQHEWHAWLARRVRLPSATPATAAADAGRHVLATCAVLNVLDHFRATEQGTRQAAEAALLAAGQAAWLLGSCASQRPAVEALARWLPSGAGARAVVALADCVRGCGGDGALPLLLPPKGHAAAAVVAAAAGAAAVQFEGTHSGGATGADAVRAAAVALWDACPGSLVALAGARQWEAVAHAAMAAACDLHVLDVPAVALAVGWAAGFAHWALALGAVAGGGSGSGEGAPCAAETLAVGAFTQAPLAATAGEAPFTSDSSSWARAAAGAVLLRLAPPASGAGTLAPASWHAAASLAAFRFALAAAAALPAHQSAVMRAVVAGAVVDLLVHTTPAVVEAATAAAAAAAGADGASTAVSTSHDGGTLPAVLERAALPWRRVAASALAAASPPKSPGATFAAAMWLDVFRTALQPPLPMMGAFAVGPGAPPDVRLAAAVRPLAPAAALRDVAAEATTHLSDDDRRDCTIQFVRDLCEAAAWSELHAMALDAKLADEVFTIFDMRLDAAPFLPADASRLAALGIALPHPPPPPTAGGVPDLWAPLMGGGGGLGVMVGSRGPPLSAVEIAAFLHNFCAKHGKAAAAVAMLWRLCRRLLRHAGEVAVAARALDWGSDDAESAAAAAAVAAAPPLTAAWRVLHRLVTLASLSMSALPADTPVIIPAPPGAGGAGVVTLPPTGSSGSGAQPVGIVAALSRSQLALEGALVAAQLALAGAGCGDLLLSAASHAWESRQPAARAAGGGAALPAAALQPDAALDDTVAALALHGRFGRALMLTQLRRATPMGSEAASHTARLLRQLGHACGACAAGATVVSALAAAAEAVVAVGDVRAGSAVNMLRVQAVAPDAGFLDPTAAGGADAGYVDDDGGRAAVATLARVALAALRRAHRGIGGAWPPLYSAAVDGFVAGARAAAADAGADGAPPLPPWLLATAFDDGDAGGAHGGAAPELLRILLREGRVTEATRVACRLLPPVPVTAEVADAADAVRRAQLARCLSTAGGDAGELEGAVRALAPRLADVAIGAHGAALPYTYFDLVLLAARAAFGVAHPDTLAAAGGDDVGDSELGRARAELLARLTFHLERRVLVADAERFAALARERAEDRARPAFAQRAATLPPGAR